MKFHFGQTKWWLLLANMFFSKIKHILSILQVKGASK